MFSVRASGIPGCLEIQTLLREDARGNFVKVFHADAFRELGLETTFREEFYTTSKRGVMRGLHFQVPPCDHVKLVYCTEGSVFDVALDIRRGSPHFGRFAAFELSAAKGNAVYLDKGFAHGFLVTSASATLVYKLSSVHSPAHDQGILWNSAGIPWPGDAPVMSARDRALPAFADFDTPFRYEP